SALLEEEVEHALGRARTGRKRVRGPDVAATPRVAHPGNEPALEPRSARRIAVERVQRALASVLRARGDAVDPREHHREGVEVDGIYDDVVAAVPERGADTMSAGAHGAAAGDG